MSERLVVDAGVALVAAPPAAAAGRRRSPSSSSGNSSALSTHTRHITTAYTAGSTSTSARDSRAVADAGAPPTCTPLPSSVCTTASRFSPGTAATRYSAGARPAGVHTNPRSPSSSTRASPLPRASASSRLSGASGVSSTSSARAAAAARPRAERGRVFRALAPAAAATAAAARPSAAALARGVSSQAAR